MAVIATHGGLAFDTGQFRYPQGWHKLDQRVLSRLPDHVENTGRLPKSKATFFRLPVEEAQFLT